MNLLWRGCYARNIPGFYDFNWSVRNNHGNLDHEQDPNLPFGASRLLSLPEALTKHNFYIITGGPGAGKTTILENLASKGYRHIPETARQIIKDRLSKGLSPRPDPLTFASEIFRKDFSNYDLNIDYTAILFFDRSYLDSAWQIFNSDKDQYHQLRDTHFKHRYNKKVFITPPWKEIYQTDSERDQSFEDSIKVYQGLHQWYEKHSYELLVIPKDSIENRVGFILSQIFTASPTSGTFR
ncbi:MAG: hypothetical protein C5B59_18350 [Bacteroidetes bacterium]|nr:MAG: hypothetical protein C5B59_18350 [Bacteroidota bacterium]